jgi:hypothetical protein
MADIDAAQRVSPVFRVLSALLVLATVLAILRAFESPELPHSVGLIAFAIVMSALVIYLFGYIAAVMALTGRVPIHLHRLVMRCTSGGNKGSHSSDSPPNNRIERPREP